MGLTSAIRFIWTNPSNHGRRLEKLLAAFEWQLHKRVLKRPRVIRLANGRWFKAYPDCVISSAVQYADWPEYHELHYCRRALKPGDALIDIGANVGHFSLLLADVVAPDNIFCFEPTPVSWRRLKENFTLNAWPTDKLLNAAAGANPGTAYFPDTNSPLTTNRAVSEKAANVVEVRQVALDQFADRFAPGSVGFLKIDVEGHEQSVFDGARVFLKNVRPRLLMFESLSGQIEPGISQILESYDYSVFQLDDKGFPCTTRTDAQNLFAMQRRAMKA